MNELEYLYYRLYRAKRKGLSLQAYERAFRDWNLRHVSGRFKKRQRFRKFQPYYT